MLSLHTCSWYLLYVLISELLVQYNKQLKICIECNFLFPVSSPTSPLPISPFPLPLSSCYWLFLVVDSVQFILLLFTCIKLFTMYVFVINSVLFSHQPWFHFWKHACFTAKNNVARTFVVNFLFDGIDHPVSCAIRTKVFRMMSSDFMHH